MTSKVFISYTSKDLRSAQRICVELESRGFRCWIAPRDIQPGGDFAEEIAESIRSCKIFLVVLSRNANNSREMPKELGLADRARALVIPVHLEDVEPSIAFSYQLANRQRVDIFTGWEAGLDRLASRIGLLISPERRTHAAADPQPRPQPPRRSASATDGGAAKNKPVPLVKPARNILPRGPVSSKLVGGVLASAGLLMGWLLYAALSPSDTPVVQANAGETLRPASAAPAEIRSDAAHPTHPTPSFRVEETVPARRTSYRVQ